MNKLKTIPQFKNEDEENKFWQNADLTEYFSPEQFVKLKDSSFYKDFTKSITLRIPVNLLSNVKKIASYIGVPYQKRIKEYIQEGIERDKSLLLNEQVISGTSFLLKEEEKYSIVAAIVTPEKGYSEARLKNYYSKSYISN